MKLLALFITSEPGSGSTRIRIMRGFLDPDKFITPRLMQINDPEPHYKVPMRIHITCLMYTIVLYSRYGNNYIHKTSYTFLTA